MDKKQIITILHHSKPDHIQWIKQAHKVVAGKPRNQIKKPLSCTQCLLGRWYDREGYKMVNVPQLPALEKLHKDVHVLYTEIYYITFDRRQKARSTIISGNLEIPVDEKQFRQQKLQLLEKKAVTLVRLLNAIENEVSNMETKVFDSPWLN
jgi:hypothetical protein